MGFTVPPYPSSLKVTGLTCEMVAVLEFQDGSCPWYYVLIPNSAWPTTGTAPKIVFRYPDEAKSLYTNSIQLPPRTAQRVLDRLRGRARQHHRVGHLLHGLVAADQHATSSTPTTRGRATEVCGGAVKPIDPCSPPQPSGYHTVHFRYLWAGQKTFTFFPKPCAHAQVDRAGGERPGQRAQGHLPARAGSAVVRMPGA